MLGGILIASQGGTKRIPVQPEAEPELLPAPANAVPTLTAAPC